jgi:hypothetical protein
MRPEVEDHAGLTGGVRLSAGKEKKKEKGERKGLQAEAGWVGYWAVWPRAGPVGLLPFFSSFIFLFFAILILVWYLGFKFI